MAAPNGVSQNGAAVVRKPVDRDAVPDPVTALKNVLDLTNTTHHDKTVQQLPPVTHEFVQPLEHNIITEHITREIHTHDVFHRILPVIEVEILPTKHYVMDLERPGILKEISVSEAPQRNNWHISHNITATPQAAVATNSLSKHELSNLIHRAHEKAAPVLSSKKSYMTTEGYMKTEYVWRHPPTLDWSAYDRGETVPLRMNCMDESKFSDFLVGQPNHARTTAEKNISAKHGTYGHGREVPELQKQALSSLEEQRAVFQTPTTNGGAAAKTAAIAESSSSKNTGSGTSRTSGPKAAAQASTANGAIAAASGTSSQHTSAARGVPAASNVNRAAGESSLEEDIRAMQNLQLGHIVDK